MESFGQYLEQQEFVEFVSNAFGGQAGTVSPAQKPWSAKKGEVIAMWEKLLPDIPIIMTPMKQVRPGEESSSYGEDGIRLSGSWNFIAGVMSRLKELLIYENPSTKLRLIFRGVDSTIKDARPDRPSFVFYVNLQPRKKSTKRVHHAAGQKATLQPKRP